MSLVITPQEALLWCSRGFGLALLQQSAESLVLGRAFRALGLWRVGRFKEHRWADSKVQMALQSVRFALGAALLGFGPSSALFVATVLTLVGLVPTEGAANGGSDAMTVTLGLGLSWAWLFQERPTGAVFGLYFIAVHSALSYFVAGLSKLKEPMWRDGSALKALAQLTRYSVGAKAAAWLLRPGLFGRGLCASVLAMECMFPLALFSRELALGFIALGAVFHLVNAALLGLHRFWPVWLATYPAIYLVAVSP